MKANAPDESFMRRALDLALQGWGRTHPNPMVGAVIVENGKIVAEGFHAKDGTPHAEKVAFSRLKRKPKAGATLYVTLEPCSTPGRTGACTDDIIASGIKHVVYGAKDPHKEHAGNANTVLKDAGINVVSGFLESECEDINLIFNHHITYDTPFFAAKAAVTLDGRTATRSGDSKWITSDSARLDVHRWRRLFPAIAVGAGTVAKDNPKLTARLPGEEEWCPYRFVFDGRLRTVNDRSMPTLYTDQYKDKTIVVTTQHGGLGYVRKLKSMGVQVWTFDSKNQRVNLKEFRDRCNENKITGVFFEGGSTLLSELIQAKQIDYLYHYVAPIFLADEKAKAEFGGLRIDKIAHALRLNDVRYKVLESDFLMRGKVIYPKVLQSDESSFSME
jgi:diaminohydroxyphosphoribosylaminopyrimidine deaminase/5-amino-6-(5-phosphoribosylamino)uracil reductase